MSETIFALSSGAGRAGVAVIRVSGPAVAAVIEALSGRAPPCPRQAALRCLIDPMDGSEIDHALVLYFRAPHSFTGEDVAEFHVHGGLAIIERILGILGRQPGCAPAQPGAFTRRAFENGRMDLTQAEAIADLIDAETEAQHRQALRQMGGALSALYEGWRSRLLADLAHLEADIDFPDEDLPGSIAPGVLSDLAHLEREIAAHLADSHRGERIRSGVSVAIVGPPNAGKSSLMNALARRDVAIVSQQAGTTRDVIEVHLDLAGYPVILADTAGLRDTSDTIEDEGVRRARARAERADLKLLVFDAAAGAPPADLLALRARQDLLIANKADLAAAPGVAGTADLAVSAVDGAGLPQLLEMLGERVAQAFGASEAPVLTRARHRAAMEEARDALYRARHAPGLELAAEDARLAMRALGRITGRVDVEDLLDVIFKDFCIGK